MGGVQGLGEQPSGNERQQHTRGLEESGEVETHAAAVDAVADAMETARPRVAPMADEATLVEALNAATRKTAVSRPSRRTARNAIAMRPSAEPVASAARCFSQESARRASPHRFIHTIIQVTRDDGDHGDDRLQPLLLATGKLLANQVQRDAGCGAYACCGEHAGPHPAQGVAPLLAGEKRSDDADDQRGFKAFTEADHEGGEHGAVSASKVWGRGSGGERQKTYSRGRYSRVVVFPQSCLARPQGCGTYLPRAAVS